MTKIELKLGHQIFKVSEKDLILDNGKVALLITQYRTKNWSRFSPTMSKKMFKDLKKFGYLYTNDKLQEHCQENYHSCCTLYAFNIQRMLQDGYPAAPES